MDAEIFEKIIYNLEKTKNLDLLKCHLDNYNSNNISILDAIIILVDMIEICNFSFENSETIIISFFLDFIEKYSILIDERLHFITQLKKLNSLLTNQKLAIHLAEKRSSWFNKKMNQ